MEVKVISPEPPVLGYSRELWDMARWDNAPHHKQIKTFPHGRNRSALETNLNIMTNPDASGACANPTRRAE